jgi:hypothetical protein
VEAHRLYCDVTVNKFKYEHSKDAIESLEQSISLNPYFSEAHILLGQLYIHTGSDIKMLTDNFQNNGIKLVKRFVLLDLSFITKVQNGIQLLQVWGTVSDKRTSWEAWIAWARVSLFLSPLIQVRYCISRQKQRPGLNRPLEVARSLSSVLDSFIEINCSKKKSWWSGTMSFASVASTVLSNLLGDYVDGRPT